MYFFKVKNNFFQKSKSWAFKIINNDSEDVISGFISL